MDILDLLSGQLNNEDVLNQLSKSSGADLSQIQQAVKLGIPTLLQALGKNASSTDEAAASLTSALDKHKDDDIDDIESFLKNVNTEDGSKILEHIFSGNSKNVMNNLSKQTGMQSNQVSNIMAKLAPMLMGMLGKQKASQNIDSSNLASMLNGIVKSQSSKDNNLMDVASKLLDADKDGSIVDDIGGFLGGLLRK